MICKLASRMLFSDKRAKPIFKIVNKNLIAGYRGMHHCVFYYLNWYALLDGYLKPLYSSEIPFSLSEFKGCRKYVVIGAYKDVSIRKSVILVNIAEAEIHGFQSFRFNRIVKNALRDVSIDSIINEIEEIYALNKSDKGEIYGEIQTWYPVIDKGYKKFIFVEEDTIGEVTSR